MFLRFSYLGALELDSEMMGRPWVGYRLAPIDCPSEPCLLILGLARSLTRSKSGNPRLSLFVLDSALVSCLGALNLGCSKPARPLGGPRPEVRSAVPNSSDRRG